MLCGEKPGVTPASPRHENLRLTYDSRRQWIESLGATHYPSLLDILFFRRAKYLWSELVLLVELLLQLIEKVPSELIRCGYCDINSRGDDVLIKAGSRHIDDLVEGLEAFHPVIVTSLELARRLKAALPAHYIEVSRERSSSLVITLFAEHVAEDPLKRKTVLATSKKTVRCPTMSTRGFMVFKCPDQTEIGSEVDFHPLERRKKRRGALSLSFILATE